jgi:hypothetical protein
MSGASSPGERSCHRWYPEGVVKSGTIRRRAGDLVTFETQQKDVMGTELVLVDAIDGAIVSTIHQDPGVRRRTRRGSALRSSADLTARRTRVHSLRSRREG